MSPTHRLISGDCRKAMAEMAEGSIDSIVTDPPYGLTQKNESPRRASPDSERREKVGGFMRMAWDSSIPGIEFWESALYVAKPGAHLVAFGGPRTFHRLAVAIEDAGWEIRDCLCWLYGSGFPKSHNGAWGGTALKPAWEPIVLARKPFDGTVEDNVRLHGTGALNIDACRIPSAHGDGRWSGDDGSDVNSKPGYRGGFKGGAKRHSAGRWPANLVLDESAAVVLDVHAPEAGAFAPVRGTEPSTPAKNTYGEFKRGGGAFHNDGRGGASRFFYVAKASRAERNAGLTGFPQKDFFWSNGKRNPGTFQSSGTMKAAENHHPTVKPVRLMSWLCKLITPAGGRILDPFMGSGSTGVAAAVAGFQFVGCEIDPEYLAIAQARIAHAAPASERLAE